ncbi:4-hydroxybutyryl-CoA dehydratase [Paenibacillus hemerocallicola]|uniref:4-hydroxybutyryl-CoA dehydratase n=1 Tax=Paenibacillus hemerocallicola TaxID=1172614 RepID=A0A5C4TAA1_9BACL|nr:4-hydroxyphenylacetate 3-hydroxylase N-terminal domain-containing protein [Paenibacillus hemerocallicola]TNJ65973.1 4-hydroxybutyryl-CoA dehydratase [Paenibacillus hemerocallicola]
MMTPEQYVESLRSQQKEVYFMGDRVDNVVDHPAMRPHIHAASVTYKLGTDPEYEQLGTARSHLTGKTINRWTHIPQNQEDLVKKAQMLRVAGQITGTCFQRCVGMDALITLYTVTWDMDQKLGTNYHERFRSFLVNTQDHDYMTVGAMTDPKGDRSKRPSQQHDPDLYVRVVEKNDRGIIVRGAKMHQTGAVNSHQILVMPGMGMSPEEAEYAVSFAVPADELGIVYVFGRQVNDSRKWEGSIDQGNPVYGVVGGEALIIFEDVFVPWEQVFMCGETDFTGILVDRFASYHRQNYGACKAGNLDVLIGATTEVAEMHGVLKAGHVRDKLAEMAHLVETMYGGALACSYNCSTLESGAAFVDPLIANTSKYNTGRYYPEVTRLAQDIAGGFIATIPSEQELDNPRVSGYIRKYYKTGEHVDPVERIKMGRLIENMTGATPIVECMHGAGSPQAQRVVVQRSINWNEKKQLARNIVGKSERHQMPEAE